MASAMTAMGIGALAMDMRAIAHGGRWGGVAEPLWEQAIWSKRSTGLACRAYFVGVFGNTSKHQRAFCVSDGII